MFKNFESFIYSSKENFPIAECTIRSNTEPGVFDSESIYQVLYIDIRFPNKKMITYAKPYICKQDNGNTTFGWVAISTSEIFGNIEDPCRFWDEFVVGFTPADKNFRIFDKAIFDSFKDNIEYQHGNNKKGGRA